MLVVVKVFCSIKCYYYGQNCRSKVLISRVWYGHATGLVKPHLFVIQLKQPIPLAIATLTSHFYACLHNLRLFDLKTALTEIERVGEKGYVMVESYRHEQELFNLQCWALTCESFFDDEEWIWLYQHFGYTGDYEFIYFE